MDWVIGIKLSARISAGVDNCPCFSTSVLLATMIPTGCINLQNFLILVKVHSIANYLDLTC